MPLLDHFHPPLYGLRRWEGFHHAWATVIAQQLNHEVLPADYFAEPEISVKPLLNGFETRVFHDHARPEVRAAIELVSPANKEGPASRRAFAAKCARYLQNRVGVVIVDVVTAQSANLHEVLFEVLEVANPKLKWKSPTGLYVVAYRTVVERHSPHLDIWAEPLALGKALPVMPLWLSLDLSVPLRLEESYVTTCQSLRISA